MKLPSLHHPFSLVLGSLIAVCMCIYLVLAPSFGEARYMMTFRDTLSNSAPGESSNHTIEFTLTTDVPPGGYLRIRPGDGEFAISSSTTFDLDQVELYVAPPLGSFTLRDATTSADATYDGVTITYGANPEVEWTLNSSQGIDAGSDVRVKLGAHTTNSTSTDTGITNPSATGTMPIYIEAGGGAEEASARALVAIIENVSVAPVDTTEDIPPIRFNGLPSGTLSGLVTAAEISLETDEFARCRYDSVPGTAYFSMNSEFTNTGSVYHSFVATGLVPETTYTYYVRCIDDELNYNTDDYEITFTLAPLPEGEPGGGEDESTGGNPDGNSTGSTGSGSGSSGGNTGSTESGSGGSRGGGGGGGGLNNDDLPYESGDGRVIVSGYAFPGSKITLLIDGDEVRDNISVNNAGFFTTTVEEIANGVYSFSVYATDRAGVKSSPFTTTFTVSGSRESTLSNIRLMPTIKVTPDPVDIGAQVTYSGYAIPDSTVTLETQPQKSSAGLKTYTATSDGNGSWSYSVSTTGFSRDTWKIRAKSVQTTGSIATNFSQYTFYGVGGASQALTGNNSDLNRDGKVNLIDFSILLFHWNTDGGTSDPPADINRDGKVNLTDFSIMIFNWTG